VNMMFFECMQMLLHLGTSKKYGRWYIEERWLSFAVDDVNPFGELKYIYSVSYVFVINNNIPNWMSIKREHKMLAMIVRGSCLQYLFEHSTISFVLLFVIIALFIIHKQGINYVYFQPIR
jgi:hypothetical protein